MEQFPVLQQDEADIEQKQRIDAMENKKSTSAGAAWILAMLEKTPEYSERIPLNRDRTFNIPRGVSELPLNISQLVRSAYRMEWSQKGLRNLAKEISKIHPELKFSFIVNPEGQWIEYSAKKQLIDVGDTVLWESDGTLQWNAPKRIISIHEDPKSERKYAFVDGVTTALPLDELIISQQD